MNDPAINLAMHKNPTAFTLQRDTNGLCQLTMSVYSRIGSIVQLIGIRLCIQLFGNQMSCIVWFQLDFQLIFYTIEFYLS